MPRVGTASGHRPGQRMRTGGASAETETETEKRELQGAEPSGAELSRVPRVCWRCSAQWGHPVCVLLGPNKQGSHAQSQPFPIQW